MCAACVVAIFFAKCVLGLVVRREASVRTPDLEQYWAS